MGIAGLGPSTNAWCDVASFCVAALSLPALFVAPGRAVRRSDRASVTVLRRSFGIGLGSITVGQIAEIVNFGLGPSGKFVFI